VTSPRATALGDQMDAANRDTAARLGRFATTRDYDVSSPLGQTFDRLLAETVRAMVAAAVAGSPPICAHIPGASVTDGAVMLTWSPYQVRCPACAAEQLSLGGAESCAVCGTSSPTRTAALYIPGRSREIDGRLVAFPPGILVASLCEDCCTREATR